ncbi:MAG: glycosyltransferase family 4 protein [Thermoleophilia bacterium]
MKRVLALAYHFPPIGGAGVQRSVKMVRYLPDDGWEPVVVTGPGTPAGRWTPVDDALAAEVGEGVEVHRVQGPRPPAGSPWRRRGERWLRLRSPFSRWWQWGAVAAGLRVEGPVDAVYASMAPFESGAAAVELARRLRRPCVLDLRDPWALDEMVVYPTGLHRRREVAAMGRLLARADAVVMNTPEAARLVHDAFPGLGPDVVRVIPNGFDAEDFDGPEPARDDDAFRIVHTGYLHTELGRRTRRQASAGRVLRGGAGRVDILTRSHVHLVAALNRLAADDPALAARIELHLAGVLSEADLEVARSCAVTVRTPGYLDHDASIALVRSADLLFLPMHDLPGGGRSSIVPGKTYEYLASGRPVLAAVPEGDARDLLVAAGTARVCAPGDADGMRRIVAEAAAGGRVPTADTSAALAPYERRRLAARLAGVLDAVTA